MISEHKDLHNTNEKPEMIVYDEELEEGEIPILQTRPIIPNKTVRLSYLLSCISQFFS